MVISVTSVSKIFRKRTGSLWQRLFAPIWQESRAVDKINFTIDAGEAVAFLGPNGAGKTTTTKMLTGLIYPSKGRIKVLGFTPSERKREFLCSIGLVMGNKAGLNWDLTARQSFSLLKQMYHISDQDFKERVKHYSSLLKVDHKLDTQVRRLSLGERMKLELIGAILHAPEVLFLDEPTIGLDIESKQALRTFLKQLHKEQGVTILLTSHDMDDVEAVCERVVVINHGSIVYDGSMHELSNRYRDERFVRIQLAKAVETSEAAKFGEVVDSNSEGTQYLLGVSRADLPAALSGISSKLQIADITIEATPLEQIIGDLYHKK
jgi:ABC-2 type transport system ATP-binding protein